MVAKIGPVPDLPDDAGPTGSAAHDGASPVEEADLELTFRCGRPKCRHEFSRKAGVGRRRQYCSDTCRSANEREYKRAKSALAHYELLLDQARADVQTFGREPDGFVGADLTEANVEKLRLRARETWKFASGVAEFAEAGNPRLVEVLKDLVDATAPMLGDSRTDSATG